MNHDDIRGPRRSPPTSPQLTLDNAVEIHLRRWRGDAQHTLAAAFGVNQGRISEVLSGKRFPEARVIALGRNAGPPLQH